MHDVLPSFEPLSMLQAVHLHRLLSPGARCSIPGPFTLMGQPRSFKLKRSIHPHSDPLPAMLHLCTIRRAVRLARICTHDLRPVTDAAADLGS